MTFRTLIRQPPFRVLLLAAPVIFIAHFMEEAPGFVGWFNLHVDRGISMPLFWSVNYTALGITIAAVIFEWLSGTVLSASLAVAWLSCLMLANALFHIVGAFTDGAYMPGLATALLLYLPFYAWVINRVVRQRRISSGGIGAAALLGAMPMLTHGYLIIFHRSRLF